jgi:hypothetical protein
MAQGDERHGKRYVYVSYGCHCDACTKANKDYCLERKLKRPRGTCTCPSEKCGLPQHDKRERHGTRNGYINYNCRCDACKHEHSMCCAAYQADLVTKKRNAA